MEYLQDFDLDSALEEKTALAVRPQLRFLWQTASVTDEYLKVYGAEIGVPFSYGYDGICLQESRKQPPAWWRLTVGETYCRLNFGGEEGLRAGLDFALTLWKIVPDGRMFLPVGVWDNQAKGL